MKIKLRSSVTAAVLLALVWLIAWCACSVNGFGLYQNHSSIPVTEQSEYLNPPYPIQAELNTDETNSVQVDYRLFGMRLDRADYTLVSDNTVYLGGFPLGITMKTKGLMITSVVNVVTKSGTVMPFAQADIRYGDILQSINGTEVQSAEDIDSLLGDGSEEITVSVRRGQEVLEYRVRPAIDVLSGKPKLGLMMQDSIAGIGTMTFIDPKDMRFSALGHPIKDASGADNISQEGFLFPARIEGAVAGQRGKAGELKGTFSAMSPYTGRIQVNNTFGIFGDYIGEVGNLERVPIASRHEVKPGKAYIATTIAGDKPKLYEIEIIKVQQQSSAQDKSMVLRVKDRELLEQTGGIVQGMSGSPILQNGKLVGAVTHVFIQDPTKGYGVFADWMHY